MGMSTSAGASGGRRGGRVRRGGAPMSEINVTPFVDVMLVLLIIFMVAAPLLTVGVPVSMPESRAEALPAPESAPLTISLDARGIVYLQEGAVAPGSLEARLEAVALARRDAGELDGGAVFLRADRGLDYGRVMEVMGALSAAGFRNIALVSDQRVEAPN
ncbi:MAG: ExbD/TolR family protein [Pseudomonadota bacterium]